MRLSTGGTIEGSGMFETATVLYAAHLLADFVFQTDWMVARKRQPGVFALHIAVVVALTAALAGTLSPVPLLIIAVAHAGLDLFKQSQNARGLTVFAIDQAGHFLSILMVAALFPGLFAAGLWGSPPDWLPAQSFGGAAYLWALILISGFIVTVRVGGFVVDLFIKRFGYTPNPDDPGLADGGYYIGLLERTVVFLLVIANQIGGIGFLVAAKSVLRFGISQERKTSEYVIIGTLASFAWALVAAFLTRVALGQVG